MCRGVVSDPEHADSQHGDYGDNERPADLRLPRPGAAERYRAEGTRGDGPGVSDTVAPMATTAGQSTPHNTHEVINQPPPLLDFNAFDADPALAAALERHGGEWGVDRCRDMGTVVASAEADDHRRRAQRNLPILHSHDRFGHRIDQVEYDPSMHWMLRLGIEREVSSLPWRDPRPGAHVVRAGLFYLMNQLDTGPCCPVSINYAAVPTMRQSPELASDGSHGSRSPTTTAIPRLGWS